MRKYLQIWLLVGCLLAAFSADAEIIRLKSGKTLQGTVVFRNDEVVVFKDATGARFQYPMSDVESIASDDELEEEVMVEEVEVVTGNRRKVALSLQLMGGGLALPKITSGDRPSNVWGGNVGADLMIGACNLLDRRIFLGGGIGYHGAFVDGQTLSFLPVQLRAEVPLMQTAHAPLLGLGVGYGIGIKNVVGGLYAAADFGWKYSFSSKGAFYLGLYANFQNARLTVTDTVAGNDYTSSANRNLCGFGAKAALYF